MSDVALYPSAPSPKDIILRPAPTIPLIEQAILEVQSYRIWRNTKGLGLHHPTTSKAYRETFYLQLRQDIFKGVRVVSKTPTDRFKRTIVYQILIMALTDIFQHGHLPKVVKPYNDLLDKMIGYH